MMKRNEMCGPKGDTQLYSGELRAGFLSGFARATRTRFCISHLA
jgi:hypothetical protein